MAANSNTTSATQRKSAASTTQRKSAASTTQRKSAASAPKTTIKTSRTSYARQTAERSLDLPVGAVLTVADRFNDIVEPFTKRQTAERELKSFRTQVERELNKLERRGATSRRKTRTRVRQTRNRFERQLKQRRRAVQTTVKQNRVKAEDGLKRAQTVVQERVSTLV